MPRGGAGCLVPNAEVAQQAASALKLDVRQVFAPELPERVGSADKTPAWALTIHGSENAQETEGLRAVLVWDLCLRDSTLTNELQEPGNAAEAGAALDRLAPVPLVHADCFDGAAVRARLRQRWERRTDTLSSFLGADFAAKGRATGAAEVAVVG